MLAYTEYDGDKTKFVALYDYKGKVLAISVGTCFNDKLYNVDVERFQQIDPQLFAHIQNRINEALGQYPHLS